MTESMIERITKAIKFVEEGPCDPATVATIALEAMREPTDLMVDAANALDVVSKGVLITPIPSQAWGAMIDAALIWPQGSADIAGVPMARD